MEWRRISKRAVSKKAPLGRLKQFLPPKSVQCENHGSPHSTGQHYSPENRYPQGNQASCRRFASGAWLVQQVFDAERRAPINAIVGSFLGVGEPASPARGLQTERMSNISLERRASKAQPKDSKELFMIMHSSTCF